MRIRFLLPAALLVCVAACSGEASQDWGEELTAPIPQGTATLYRSAAVDLDTANKVLAAMTDGNYNFAAGLPEQIDMVDGRLTLRLGNDNQDTIAEIKAEGDAHAAVSYFHGLANHVSRALDGAEIDIILCEETLDTPFHTVKWTPQQN